jgi:HEAT repeat protein
VGGSNRNCSRAGWEAARSLGRIDSGRSVFALIAALRDQKDMVRVEAAEALGVAGDSRALPGLRRSLRDRSWLVRSYAAEAIGRLGDSGDVPRLSAAMRRERVHRAKVGFLLGLYFLGQPLGLKGLIGLLESPQSAARSAAVGALNWIADCFSSTLTDRALLRRLRRAGRPRR